MEEVWSNNMQYEHNKEIIRNSEFNTWVPPQQQLQEVYFPSEWSPTSFSLNNDSQSTLMNNNNNSSSEMVSPCTATANEEDMLSDEFNNNNNNNNNIETSNSSYASSMMYISPAVANAARNSSRELLYRMLRQGEKLQISSFGTNQTTPLAITWHSNPITPSPLSSSYNNSLISSSFVPIAHKKRTRDIAELSADVSPLLLLDNNNNSEYPLYKRIRIGDSYNNNVSNGAAVDIANCTPLYEAASVHSNVNNTSSNNNNNNSTLVPRIMIGDRKRPRETDIEGELCLDAPEVSHGRRI